MITYAKNQKRALFAYALLLNRSGESKDWERVEPSFSSKYDATSFRERRYSDVKLWRVEGIRFDVRPLTGKEVA